MHLGQGQIWEDQNCSVSMLAQILHLSQVVPFAALVPYLESCYVASVGTILVDPDYKYVVTENHCLG